MAYSSHLLFANMLDGAGGKFLPSNIAYIICERQATLHIHWHNKWNMNLRTAAPGF